MKNTIIEAGLNVIKLNPNYICHHSITDFGGEIHVMHVFGISYMKMYWYNDNEKELYMADLNVSQDSRENGIGNHMLKMFCLVGQAMEIEQLTLAVIESSWMYKWYVRNEFWNNKLAKHDDADKVWLDKKLNNE